MKLNYISEIFTFEDVGYITFSIREIFLLFFLISNKLVLLKA
jgi:hypothetical protein